MAFSQLEGDLMAFSKMDNGLMALQITWKAVSWRQKVHVKERRRTCSRHMSSEAHVKEHYLADEEPSQR